MHDLKERFEPVKLSDAQKERILQNVKEGRMEPARPLVQKGPLFASVIVGISVLFLMFDLLSGPDTILQPDGSQAAEQGQSGFSLDWEVVIWNIVAVVLMILAMLATKRAVMQVKRWQSTSTVQRLKPILENKLKFIVTILALATLIFGGSFLFNGALIYVQIWLGIYYVLGFFMLEAYYTRDNVKSCCPHCGVQFTRKQVREKTKWQYRETCDACEKPIFVDPKRNGNSALFVYPTFFAFYTLLDMHYLLVAFMIISSLWIVYKYISPYSVQFIAEQKDDPKMW